MQHQSKASYVCKRAARCGNSSKSIVGKSVSISTGNVVLLNFCYL